MPRNQSSILIVDDTAIYRQIFRKACEQIPAVSRVEVVRNGRDAVRAVEAEAFDLVVCDLIMPEMDGLETLKAIQQVRPEQQIVVVSGVSGRDADITVEALSLGALDFIEKPRGSDMAENLNQLSGAFYRILRTAAMARPLATRKLLGGEGAKAPSKRPPATPTPERISTPPAPQAPASPGISSLKALSLGTPGLVLIGVSTGGPNALHVLLPQLPKDFPAPIALVQHMPAGFTATLARQLDAKCALDVSEAVDGEVLRPGRIVVAPGGKHLELKAGPGGQWACVVDDGPPVNSCKPAVDVLFQSVAGAQPLKTVLSVMLTGMGNDGAEGVAALKSGKCISLTQSQETCVVYGMPKAVVDRGLSDEQVPLPELAGRILEWVMPRYRKVSNA